MLFLSVFLDIAKFADFGCENADVSRTRAVLRDSYSFWIFFSYSITVPSFIIVEYV